MACRTILYTGKGGVGKTSVAAATARRCAAAGARTLVVVMALEREEAEELVEARRHRELLGADAVHAALDEQRAQPRLDAGPVALHLLLGDDLLGPQPLAELRRL